MPKFVVASYLSEIKGSYSDCKITGFTGTDQINVHGWQDVQHIIITKKVAGYYPNFNGDMISFVHARNAISPTWGDSTRRMLMYHNSTAKSEQLELDSPITVICSNLHRGGESFIFDTIVRSGSTRLVKYDFGIKTVYEYDIDGNETTHYNFYVAPDVRISGGWINTGMNMWDMFYIDHAVMYTRFNPLIEYPYFPFEYLPIGSVLTGNRSASNTQIVIGSYRINILKPKILIKAPDTGNIYSIDTSTGQLNDISTTVDLTTHSSFRNNANDWKDYFYINQSELANLMTNNDYLILIHDCRVPHFITKFDSYGLADNEFMYFRVQQYKTWSIKDAI